MLENKNMNKNWLKNFNYLWVSLIAAFSSIILYIGIQFIYQKYVTGSNEVRLDNPAAAIEKNDESDQRFLSRFSRGFRYVAKKVGPAVVTIKTAKKETKITRAKRPNQRHSPYGENDPFFDFFRHFGLPFDFEFEPYDVPQRGLGSGFVIDSKGHIVTNNHVVRGANEILVNFANQQTIDRKAVLIGADPHSDIAVIKVKDVEDLPSPLEWADSDAIEVGDWAIAIGSPFSMDQSVTVGIISAKGRPDLSPGEKENRYIGDLLQTDAAINPGNSGGPLCDIDGKVMGINRAIFTQSGGYMGIGFAIPSNIAKFVTETIITKGKVVRGWLGVSIQTITPDLAKELGIKFGVSIHEVFENSPASKSGLQPGDVVLEVDGKQIKDSQQLQRVITQKRPNDTINLKIIPYSDKTPKNIRVKIGEYPSDDSIFAATDESSEKPDELGLIVRGTKSKEGVIIEYIEPNSIASQVGLESGDIILKINRKDIKRIKDYINATKSTSRYRMLVKRKDRKLFFQFTLP